MLSVSKLVDKKNCVPRSKRTDRIRPEFNGIHRIMEAVFQVGIHRNFPLSFLLYPVGNDGKAVGKIQLLSTRNRVCGTRRIRPFPPRLLNPDPIYNPSWKTSDGKLRDMPAFQMNSESRIFISILVTVSCIVSIAICARKRCPMRLSFPVWFWTTNAILKLSFLAQ